MILHHPKAESQMGLHSMHKTSSLLKISVSGCLLLFYTFQPSCKPDDKGPVTATRADYIGLWQCDEFNKNQQLIASFQVEIINHPTDQTKVLIDNFDLLGVGNRAVAIVNGTAITLPQQLVAGKSVTGSGFMGNKLQTIDLHYTVDDGSGKPENITATCTKI